MNDGTNNENVPDSLRPDAFDHTSGTTCEARISDGDINNENELDDDSNPSLSDEDTSLSDEDADEIDIEEEEAAMENQAPMEPDPEGMN